MFLVGLIGKKYIKYIGLLLVGIIMLPILIASCFVTVQATPVIETSQVVMYMNAAKEASQGKVDVDFRPLIAIDAIRFEQDFSKASKSEAKELAERFILEKQVQVPYSYIDPETKEEVTGTTTETVYELKSIDTVLSELNFSDEDKQSVYLLMQSGLSMGNDGGSIGFNGNAQEFISKVSAGSIEGFKKYGVLPSITIAQSILESGWGQSGLTAKANNLFGIKAFNWNGPICEMPTTEYNENGVPHSEIAAFRAYPSWNESIIDHGKFLRDNPRYEAHGVFSSTNYIEQAYTIKEAGYATDPDYPLLLINIIEKYKLYTYDNQTS